MTSLSNELFARDFAIKLTELGIEHGFLEEDHGEYTINNFIKIMNGLRKFEWIDNAPPRQPLTQLKDDKF